MPGRNELPRGMVGKVMRLNVHELDGSGTISLTAEGVLVSWYKSRRKADSYGWTPMASFLFDQNESPFEVNLNNQYFTLEEA